MSTNCLIHPSMPVLLLCLQKKCNQARLCCLLCADQHHSRHQLTSLTYLHSLMEQKLQINRKNPHKHQLIALLNKYKQEILQKLQNTKNKLIGLVGKCEHKVQEYFSKIFHSFAIDSHQTLVKQMENNFNSDKISSILELIEMYQNIKLGNQQETQSLIYVGTQIYIQKISESFKLCEAALNSAHATFDNFSISKPEEFSFKFNHQKRYKNYYQISDSGDTLIRSSGGGSGGYHICLTQNPFNPINRAVAFKIDKIQGNKRSICLGVCIENIVKLCSYNCGGGINKGIYAIDQNNSYSSGQDGFPASWNNHDTNFNQSNVGASNLVGWNFGEGDIIRIEVDFLNAVVAFIKGNQDDWDEDEQIKVYQMPIKLQQGPIYAFVSCQNKGDRVTMIPV